MRPRILAALVVVVPLGFFSKYCPGPGHAWLNDYGGGVLYEVFFCLLFFLFFPRKEHAVVIATAVLTITCLLEVLQLSQAPVLLAARQTLPGQWLLGTTFVWWDFPHYLLGCALGWLLMRKLAGPEA